MEPLYANEIFNDKMFEYLIYQINMINQPDKENPRPTRSWTFYENAK